MARPGTVRGTRVGPCLGLYRIATNRSLDAVRATLPSAQGEIARPYAMFVLTLQGDRISAVTWFADSSVFPHFRLPRMLR